MLYYTRGFVLSRLGSGGCGGLGNLGPHLLLLWGLSGGVRGRRLLLRPGLLLRRGLLLLDVVWVDVLLNVQESHLNTLGDLQQILQGLVQADVLTSLQTLGLHVLVHLASHLGPRDLLTGGQVQEGTQLLGNTQRLVEAIVLGPSLVLLTGGVLNVLTNLADVLVQGTLLLGNRLEGGVQSLESHGSSHSVLYYRKDGSL
jgi:hypothetical protein